MRHNRTKVKRQGGSLITTGLFESFKIFGFFSSHNVVKLYIRVVDISCSSFASFF